MSNHVKVTLDLSQEIHPGMPVFPGSAQPEILQTSSVAVNGFAERRLTLFTHHGTHVDVPAHIAADGRHLGDFPAESFLGEAICIDVAGEGIDISTLAPYADTFRDIDFVLFATGWSRYWGTDWYNAGYPILTREAADYLAGLGLKGAGFDTLSADRADSGDLPIHRTLLAKMIIVENLTNLAKLPRSRFSFSCLPLKIAGADGSPVRAVASWRQAVAAS